MLQTIKAFPLRPARVHEACGPSAICLAAVAVSEAGGALWVRQSWRSEYINPEGLSEYVDPSTVLLAQTKDQTEALAVAE